MARTAGLVRLARGFAVIESAPVSLAVPREPSDLEALPPALVSWGVASDFLIPNGQGVSAIGKINASGGGLLDEWLKSIYEEAVEEYEEGEGDAYEEPRVYAEVERTVTVVRVENPEDSEQYVDVERIETITFRGPDGQNVKFVLNHGGA